MIAFIPKGEDRIITAKGPQILAKAIGLNPTYLSSLLNSKKGDIIEIRSGTIYRNKACEHIEHGLKGRKGNNPDIRKPE